MNSITLPPATVKGLQMHSAEGKGRGGEECDEREHERETEWLGVESYRRGLSLEEMRTAIKMIKRMEGMRVERRGKYGGMRERGSGVEGQAG